MNTPNQPNTSNDKPCTVQDIIHAIETKLVNGTYIFRGEPECNEKVSSNLWRELEVVKAKYSDIKEVQAETVAAARAYTDKTEDFEILTDLQHYGGKTNLIDFTTDYNVALFFACYGSPGEDSRVVILKKTEAVKETLKHPQKPEKRVCAQKSVFIEPPKGYIEQKYEVICIPKDLKLRILQHLQADHGIDPITIYNDIHGFISSQKDYWMAYREFYSGLIWTNKGDEARTSEEKQNAYQKAIKSYTNALERELQLHEVYNNRGIVYCNIGEVNKAIEDFTNTAIQLNPDDPNAYSNRGGAYRDRGEYDCAIKDFNKAIELNPDYAHAYHNRGGNAYRDKNAIMTVLS